MTKSFTGAEFIKALSEGSLREPIAKEGMVKPVEDDPNVIMFSEGTACQFWTKLPVEILEKVEFLYFIRCRDHEHPFVRLSLKEPPVDNNVASVLADLLRAGSKARTTSIPAGSAGTDSSSVTRWYYTWKNNSTGSIGSVRGFDSLSACNNSRNTSGYCSGEYFCSSCMSYES